MDNSTKLIVSFFKTDSGREPAREWLKKLNKESKKIIGEDIKTVQFGWPLGMPLVRKIENKIWEVRINLKESIARVLFIILGNDMVILHGFKKKSQKIPSEDLKLAKKRKKILERKQ
jgi:phage-related protein